MSETRYVPSDGGLPLRQERAAVRKGATLLDRILPGWHKTVNLETLHMASGMMCMMGQLFGDNIEGKLAKEMYPNEMAKASYTSSYGYSRAFQYDIVRKLVDMLPFTKEREVQYEKLYHVCRGHDNKCLWAEEVATRLAADTPQEGAKHDKNKAAA